MLDQNSIHTIWFELCWPLLRITGYVVLGLIVANLIESLSWTKKITQISKPLTRLAHLSPTATAGFSLAFVSGVSANSLLAEAFSEGKIGTTELTLANLFYSLPRFFLHLPTVFFLTLPFLQSAALAYVGMTLLAALVQTFIVTLLGRCLLKKPVESMAPAQENVQKKGSTDWGKLTKKIVKRIRRRLKKLLMFMVPIYIIFFLLGHYGVFGIIETFMVEKVWFLRPLDPQMLSIIILHVTAEFSAGLAAASVMLADSSLGANQVILALMIGNLLATPIRALRHQFPYYSGIYPFRTAIWLIVASQSLRATCISVVTICFYFMAIR